MRVGSSLVKYPASQASAKASGFRPDLLFIGIDNNENNGACYRY